MDAEVTQKQLGDSKTGNRVVEKLNEAEIFRRVSALLPELRARSEECEQHRRIPLDLVEKLKSAGCFRICVPIEFGGAELEIGSRLELLSLLAEAEASVGWTVAIASDTALIAVRASEEAFREIYRASPDAVFAGAAAPRGTAEIVDGGYRVSGRWGWASGSLHADWLMVNCVVTRGGQPVLSADGAGPPLWRSMIFPHAQAKVIDTWNVVGLCGTGSNDVVVENLFVPEKWTLDFFSGEPCVPRPVFKSFVAQAGLILASLAIGIARGALKDIVALTKTRKQRMLAATDMSGSELMQMRLGEAQSALDAITMSLKGQAREYVARASELPAGPAQLGHPLILSCGSMATWIVARAVEIVDMAYAAGGGSSVSKSSAIQRRFRDIHTLTSHVNLSETMAIRYGQGLLDGRVAMENRA